MAGRRKKPVNLLLFEGKSHRTKAEIKLRAESEIKFGGPNLKCPAYVKVDPVAFIKWKETIKLFRGMDFISSADVGHLARYCKTHSEYIDLVERRQKISEIEDFTGSEEDTIKEEFEGNLSAMAAKKMWQKVEFIMSTGGILSLDKAINQKMVQLVAMEDRLFLNPLAKLKNVKSATPAKPKSALEESGFGNI